MISLVIPTYKNPEYLDLCLRSAFENQVNVNQIIVVVDGFFEESEEVLKKYPDVQVADLGENRGAQIAHNTGVILAENETVFIINDDNVLPRRWDERIEKDAVPLSSIVYSPNQIEPVPSIFSSFVIQDFGKTAQEFRYDDFMEWEAAYSSFMYASNQHGTMYREDGGTWPPLFQKKLYMAVGGCDPEYPNGAVADWDLFLKWELLGIKRLRYMGMHLYHFGGAANKLTNGTSQGQNEKEQLSMEYFAWKWGQYPTLERETHSRLQNFRGISK